MSRGVTGSSASTGAPATTPYKSGRIHTDEEGEQAMKLSVQVMIDPDDTDAPAVSRQVFAADRDELAPETLGLHLSEAHELLAGVRNTLGHWEERYEHTGRCE